MFGILSTDIRRHQQTERTYLELRKKPLHGLVISCITLTVSLKASAIGVGYRDADTSASEAEGHQKQFREQMAARMPEEFKDPAEKEAAFQASTRITGPNRRSTIPLWIKIGDEIYYHLPLPVAAHPGIMQAVEELLVSVNGTEESPQPIRYVEITSEDGERQLVELNLELDEYNVFWIKIGAVRKLNQDDHISQYYY